MCFLLFIISMLFGILTFKAFLLTWNHAILCCISYFTDSCFRVIYSKFAGKIIHRI